MQHPNRDEYQAIVEQLAVDYPERAHEDTYGMACDVVSGIHFGLGTQDRVFFDEGSNLLDEPLCPISVAQGSDQEIKSVGNRREQSGLGGRPTTIDVFAVWAFTLDLEEEAQ